MKKYIAVSLCFCLVAAVPLMASEQKPLPVGDLQVSADTLGAVVLDQNIKLMMRNGTYVEGKVLRTSREEIVMNVKKSEPKMQFRGSEASLKTADIASVYMKKNGPVAAPVALGVIGGILGFVGGAMVGYASDSVGVSLLAGIGGAAGGASLGAYGGRQAAKKTVSINVVPSTLTR